MWDFFFFFLQMAISLLAYLALFPEKLLLHISLKKLLLHNSYSFGAAISSGQLLFLRSSVFERVISVIFSEYLILLSETSTEQPLLENRKFFRAVTFRNSYFYSGGIAQNKDIQRRANLQVAGASAQHQLFQKSYIFEKANFSEKKYSALPTFSGKLPFQSGYFFKRTSPSIAATFSEQLHLLFISQ